MAYADYTHCDVCDCKVYCDANVDYDWNLGSMSVICKKCAETHETIVREKANAHMKKELAAAPTLPTQHHPIDDADIRAIALDCGFRLKPQPDGAEDLSPYVYRFAREILSTTPRAEDVEALRQRPTPPARKSETDDLYGYVDEFNHLWSVDEARPELEDGNTRRAGGEMNSEQVRSMLKTACSDAGGMKYFAAKAGVSKQYICYVLLGHRDPGKKILSALGLERVVTYRSVTG